MFYSKEVLRGYYRCIGSKQRQRFYGRNRGSWDTDVTCGRDQFKTRKFKKKAYLVQG